jgi:Caspase domain
MVRWLFALVCAALPAGITVAQTQTIPPELAPYVVEHDVPKKAYVVGISTYKHQLPIPSAAKDLKDVTDRLRVLGFEVTPATPAATKDAESLLQDFQTFLAKLDRHSIVLFYFSGHGFWYDGENYLLPADVDIASPPKDPITGAVIHPARINVPVSKIRSDIANTTPGHSIIIIDACREQPVFAFPPEDPTTKAASKFRDVSGTYIFFATGEGKYSQGSTDPNVNSRYTKHFLRHVESEGWKIMDVQRATTVDVVFDSGNQQQPWFAGLYLSDIYLKPTQDQLRAEQETWIATLKGRSPQQVRRFIAMLPGSRYALAAHQWLKDHETTALAPPSTKINPIAIEAPESFGPTLNTGRLQVVALASAKPILPGLTGSLAIASAQVETAATPSTWPTAEGPSIVVQEPTNSYSGVLGFKVSRVLNQGDQLKVRNAFSVRDQNWLEAVTRDGQVVYLGDIQVPDLGDLTSFQSRITIPFRGDDVLAPFDAAGVRDAIAAMGAQRVVGVAIRLKPSSETMTDYIRTTSELRLVRLIAAVGDAGVDRDLIAGLVSSDRNEQEPNTALITVRFRN